MKWVSRSELGWPASAAPSQPTAKGVKVHYEGTPVSISTHAGCVAEVKNIRRSHLANPTENYSDIAYNLLVCKHGYVFEGRGKGKRTGANGNQDLNRNHYAVCALLGTKGDVEPTPEMVQGLRDAISYLRSHGAGKEIKGHRDGHATACPGEPLYALVKAGKLEPGVQVPKPPTKPSTPPSKPVPVYAPFPGAAFFRYGKKHPLFKAVGKRLVAEGFKGYKVGPSEEWSRTDEKGVAWFQRKHKELSGDADGKFGPLTWRLLKVPKV